MRLVDAMLRELDTDATAKSGSVLVLKFIKPSGKSFFVDFVLEYDQSSTVLVSRLGSFVATLDAYHENDKKAILDNAVKRDGFAFP